MEQEILHIGLVIKRIRTERKMSQAQLAEGICSIKYIRELEKGKYTPSTYIVIALSNRLRIDIFSMYMKFLNSGTLQYADIIYEIERAIDIYNFDEITSHLEKCERIDAFKSGPLRQFLLFAKAHVSLYRDHNLELAKEYVIEGIRTFFPDFTLETLSNHLYNNRELSLASMLATIYCTNNDIATGKSIYKQLISALEEQFSIHTRLFTYTSRSERLSYINLLSNISNCYYECEEYEDALSSADKGIALCQKHQCVDDLPRLLQCRLQALVKLGQYDEALKCYIEAEQLFNIFQLDNEREFYHTHMKPEYDELFQHVKLPDDPSNML